MKHPIDVILKIKRLACQRAMVESTRGISRRLRARSRCRIEIEEHDRIARCRAVNSTGMLASGNASMLRRCCLYGEKLTGELKQAEKKLSEVRDRVAQEDEMLDVCRKNLALLLADSKATEGVARRIHQDQQILDESREEEDWVESSQVAGCPGFVHPVRFSRTQLW